MKQTLISQDLDFQKSRCRLKGRLTLFVNDFNLVKHGQALEQSHLVICIYTLYIYRVSHIQTNDSEWLWGVKGSLFFFNLTPFLSEIVEASQCYFFEKWLMKLKCPKLLKPLGTIIQKKCWSFYPSEPFRIICFNMRHPVSKL